MPLATPASLATAPSLAFSCWLLLGLALALPATTQGQSTAPTEEAVPGDESVRPGINERWITGEVDELVGLLERDGREIFEQRVAIADLVAPARGSRVADVGAGSGFMVEELAQRVGPEGTVYGIDINGEMMDRLAERAKAAGLHQIKTQVCTETSVELPTDSVDLVFLADTYHHFEYPAQTLASIHKALVDGGHLVILDFEKIVGVSSEWVFGHVRVNKEEVIEEVTREGFVLVGEMDAPFLTENYALRFRKAYR